MTFAINTIKPKVCCAHVLGKKGGLLVPLVVVFTVIVLLGAFTALYTKYHVDDAEGKTRTIGDKQAQLFSSYQQGDNAHFFIEQASKYAALQAIHDIASNESGCGDYRGYSIWSNNETQCFPTRQSAENTFKSLFNKALDDYLLSYSDITLLPNNYVMSLSEKKENTVIALAAQTPTFISFGVKATIFSDVRVTHYYAPSESDFSQWSTGEDKKNYPNYEKYSWCVIPLSKRGFYEEVQCEGSGVSITGVPYSYTTIKPTKEESVPVSKIGTATGTVATPHRTIAVAPAMIPYNSHVKVEFQGCKDQVCCDAWNGDYIAEDTGAAMTNDWNSGVAHIDLYTGVGKSAYEAANCLPGKATLTVVSSDTEQKGIFGLYSFIPNIQTSVPYTFADYDVLPKAVREISSEFTQTCLSGGNPDSCLAGVLKKRNDFIWSVACDDSTGEQTQKQNLFRICAQSKQIILTKDGMKPVVYKIAFFAADSIPPHEVSGIAISGTPGTATNIAVSFDSSDDNDIDHYDIYYAQHDFNTLTEDGVVLAQSIHADDSAQYQTSLQLPSPGTYYVTIISVDTSGNENKEFSTQSFTTIDDVKPGPAVVASFVRTTQSPPRIELTIIPPTVNEDGSTVTDLAGYSVYFSEAIGISCSASRLLDSSTGTKIDSVTFNADGKGILELPDAKKNYCVLVVAQDTTPATQVRASQYDENSILFVNLN